MACGVRVAFTGRAGGVSEGSYASLNTATHVGDSLEAVQRNRELALEAVGAGDAPVIIPNQVHGADLVEVRVGASAEDVARVDAQAQEGADGVIVRAEGVAALMSFADCLSLVVVSPSGAFVVAHAGWRGAVAGVAGKAARALAADDPFEPSVFNAYIGPHIHSECFEVSEDVASQFVDAFGEEVVPTPTHVSLARAVSVDLRNVGVLPNRIVDCGICTVCHSDEYFSYRASDGPCGRHAAVVVRNQSPAGKSVSPGENGWKGN